MQSQRFRLTVEQESQRAVVTAAGEMDLVSVPDCREELENLAQEHREIGLDLRQVNFIDSCGALMVRDLRDNLKKKGGELVLLGASPQVQRVFSVLATAGLLTL